MNNTIENINTMLTEIGSDFRTEDGKILVMYTGSKTFLKKTFDDMDSMLKFVTEKYNKLKPKLKANNDEEYIYEEWKDSATHRVYANMIIHTGKSMNNKSDLEYRKRFVLGAIDFHTKEGNQDQLKFFSEELKFIDKKLSKL